MADRRERDRETEERVWTKNAARESEYCKDDL